MTTHSCQNIRAIFVSSSLTFQIQLFPVNTPLQKLPCRFYTFAKWFNNLARQNNTWFCYQRLWYIENKGDQKKDDDWWLDLYVMFFFCATKRICFIILRYNHFLRKPIHRHWKTISLNRLHNKRMQTASGEIRHRHLACRFSPSRVMPHDANMCGNLCRIRGKHGRLHVIKIKITRPFDFFFF